MSGAIRGGLSIDSAHNGYPVNSFNDCAAIVEANASPSPYRSPLLSLLISLD